MHFQRNILKTLLMLQKIVKKLSIEATDPDRGGEAIAWHVKKVFWRTKNYLKEREN